MDARNPVPQADPRRTRLAELRTAIAVDQAGERPYTRLQASIIEEPAGPVLRVINIRDRQLTAVITCREHTPDLWWFDWPDGTPAGKPNSHGALTSVVSDIRSRLRPRM